MKADVKVAFDRLLRFVELFRCNGEGQINEHGTHEAIEALAKEVGKKITECPGCHRKLRACGEQQWDSDGCKLLGWCELDYGHKGCHARENGTVMWKDLT